MREAHWLEVSSLAAFISPGTQGSQGETGELPGPFAQRHQLWGPDCGWAEEAGVGRSEWRSGGSPATGAWGQEKTRTMVKMTFGVPIPSFWTSRPSPSP